MTASSPPPVPPPPPASDWIVDPVRDFACYRLIDLAVAALDATFADQRLGQDYRRWLNDAKPKPGGRRTGAGRAAPVAPDVKRTPGDRVSMFELQVWRRDHDHAVHVLALPRRSEFLIAVVEEHFRAEVSAVYDPDALGLIMAGLESFTGNRQEAIRVARQFVEMIDGAAGNDDTGPSARTSGSAPRPAEETGSDPLAARVGLIVDRLAALSPERSRNGIPTRDQQFLAANPDALWVLRDGFVGQASTLRRSRPRTVAAWQIALEHQLEEIRFNAERGHDWAVAAIDRYQAELVTMARRSDVDLETWQALVIALDRAKIAIRPEVRAASVELASGAAQVPPAGSEIIRSLEEIVETGGGDPFRIAAHLFDAMAMMPPDFAQAGVSAIGGAPLPALRDVLPLVLLAPEATYRQAAAAALEQMAAEKRLTAAGLRRLITLRSWLPEAERRTVDQAIRRARLAGVDCAPWPTGQIRSLQATMIDGSGCQSVLAVAKDGNRHVFAGILIKQGFGIRDVMAERGLSRREGDTMLADVGAQVLTRPVSRPYLDGMIGHALFTGVEAGRMAPLALLEVAEVLGAADWRAERLDAEEELNRLLAELPADLAQPAGAARAVQDSGGWISMADLTGSWFEDDESVREICARHRRAPKKAAAAVLASVLEPRRAIWAERLVWMALWAGGGTAAATATAPGLPRWYDYALVARALYDGRPLVEVPLMAGIAQQTVASTG